MPGKFSRPPEVEVEWQALGSPEAEGFGERLAAARVETVVAARRQYRDTPFVDRIDEVLVAKVEPLVRAVTRSVAGDEHPLYKEEVEATIGEAFWREVLTAEDTFYEIRFMHKLKRVALDARRKVIDGKARSRERQAARIEVAVDDDSASALTVAEEDIADPRDEFVEVEDALDLFIALAAMPREVATAIDLHYRAELKIHSANPNENGS